MTTFSIETDNTITAFAEYEDALKNRIRGTEGTFTSEKEFAKLSADWPIARFAEVWNAFAGVVPFTDLKPVKKFTDRKTAVSRIWKAIQALTPTLAATGGPSRTEEGEGEQRAQSAGRRARSTRGQQESHRPRTDPAARRRQPQRDHGSNRVAVPQRTRIHQRQPHQEDGDEHRILQTRERRPGVPRQLTYLRKLCRQIRLAAFLIQASPCWIFTRFQNDCGIPAVASPNRPTCSPCNLATMEFP